MIEQTIPFAELTAGMARCVREWILPHLSDPMARLQAEQLAALLEALPRGISPAATEAIRNDTYETRALLESLGAPIPSVSTDGAVDSLVRENATLKVALEAVAERCRRGDAAARERLQAIQRFYMRSLARELGSAVMDDTYFQTLTAKDKAAKQS